MLLNQSNRRNVCETYNQYRLRKIKTNILLFNLFWREGKKVDEANSIKSPRCSIFLSAEKKIYLPIIIVLCSVGLIYKVIKKSMDMDFFLSLLQWFHSFSLIHFHYFISIFVLLLNFYLFTHSFIYLLNKYFLSVPHLPCLALCASNIAVNKTSKILGPWSLQSKEGRYCRQK